MAHKEYRMSELSHYPVNWVDGMKINKEHFTQMNRAMADAVRDQAAIHINATNYGLLSPMTGANASLELDIHIDAQNIITAQLKTCRAILKDGMRIEVLHNSEKGIYSGNSINASYTHDTASDADFAIVLSASVDAMIASGKPNATEQPIRHPYEIPAVHISILPMSQAKGSDANYLILAKLSSKDGKWSKDENYIPPCVAVQNHRKLNEAYVQLGNTLGELGMYGSTIVQKIKSEKNKTSLSLNIQYISERLIGFLADRVVFYRWLNGQRSAVFVVENFVSLAYCLKTTFDCVTEKDREEMFTYFEQWSGLKPVEFDQAIQNALKIDYDHEDISNSIQKSMQFMDILIRLFGKLSKLKFIGEQTDTGIVIGETIEPKKPEKKGGWSFLAD